MNGMVLLLLALGQAQAPAAQPPSDPVFVTRSWNESIGQFMPMTNTALRPEDRRTLERLEVRLWAGPAPAGSPCRAAATFASADPEGDHGRITLCVRNILLFSAYSASVGTGLIVNRRYQASGELADYTRLFREVHDRTRELPLQELNFRQAICTYADYLKLRHSGADPRRCLQGQVPAEAFDSWLREHPDFYDLTQLEQAIPGAGTGMSRAADAAEAMGRGALVVSFFYFALHEAGHVHLGHVNRRGGAGCQWVREEYAADEFAERVMLAQQQLPEDAWRAVQFLWTGYYLSIQERDMNTQRLGFAVARSQMLFLRLTDAIMRNPRVRAIVQQNSPGLDPAALEGIRRQVREMRTCLTSDQPVPDEPPDLRLPG